jgi:hypothetical protein
MKVKNFEMNLTIRYSVDVHRASAKPKMYFSFQPLWKGLSMI